MRDSCLLKDTGESLRGVYIHGVFCALALRPRAPFQSSANSAHPSFKKQILALLCPGLGFSGHGHRASSPSAILKAPSAFKYLSMHNAVLCRRVVKIVITIICKRAWVLTSLNRTQLSINAFACIGSHSVSMSGHSELKDAYGVRNLSFQG